MQWKVKLDNKECPHLIEDQDAKFCRLLPIKNDDDCYEFCTDYNCPRWIK